MKTVTWLSPDGLEIAATENFIPPFGWKKLREKEIELQFATRTPPTWIECAECDGEGGWWDYD